MPGWKSRIERWVLCLDSDHRSEPKTNSKIATPPPSARSSSDEANNDYSDGFNFCVSVVHAPENLFTIRDGYSLTLPRDWVEIPANVLRQLEKNISNMSNGAKNMTRIQLISATLMRV